MSPGSARTYAAPMNGDGILLVEDDDAIATGLVRVLDSQGYAVMRIARGSPAVAEATERIGLVILDLGLPDVDGITVCRRLRASRPGLAILILSARDQELDVVAGLDAGADDYLVKPFRLSELLARVRAHQRRTSGAAPPEDRTITVGAVSLDPAARRVHVAGEEVGLRPKEFELLALLLAEAGRVVTRERIMREVWDTNWMGSTKTLDTHVLALRGKIGADAITTLRGVGYRLERRVRRRLVIAIAAVATIAVVALAVPLGLVLARSYREQELLRAAARHGRRDALHRPGGRW